MSFWSTSTGENAAENAPKEFETGGGKIELIPDGSTVLAVVDKAGWEEDKSFNNYINIKWKVQAPAEVENRVVFQKLWVRDPDPRAKDADVKRDKALRMLAAIDANAGGRLAKNGGEPTDDQLMLALANKPMAITVRVWEMDTAEGRMEGNWVAAVAPKGKELKIATPAKPKPAAGGNAKFDDLDDDVPF